VITTIADASSMSGHLQKSFSSDMLSQFADFEGHMDSKGGKADFRNSFVA
jgi:hypothetical protein